MADEYSPGVQEYVQRGEALTAAEENHRTAMRAMKFDTIAVHGMYGMEAAVANQGSIV